MLIQYEKFKHEGIMKIKLPIAVLFLFTTLFTQNDNLQTSLGVSAGLVSGTGLSYRHVGDNGGFQFTFGIMSFPSDRHDEYDGMQHTAIFDPYYWSPDTSSLSREYEYGGGGTWANGGLLYIKPLHRAKRSMFYLLAGVSVYYNSSTDYYRDYRYTIISDSIYTYEAVSDYIEENEKDITFRAGIGIGLEYQYTENIRISLDLPLMISDDKRISMLIPEAGIYYYFK